MTVKSTTMTLKHLASRLHEQSMEVAALRSALEAQTKRIAAIQSELDLWPHSPGLRRAVRALGADLPFGNGHHRQHR
jgi:hypothetical protein